MPSMISLHGPGQGGPPDPRWYPKVKRDGPDRRRLYRPCAPAIRAAPPSIWRSPLPDAAAVAAPDPDCGARKGLRRSTSEPVSTVSTCAATPPIRPCLRLSAANRNRLARHSCSRPEVPSNYSHEWWHFTLNDEPHKVQHFDFPITGRVSRQLPQGRSSRADSGRAAAHSGLRVPPRVRFNGLTWRTRHT